MRGFSTAEALKVWPLDSVHQNQGVGVGGHVFKILNPHHRQTESASLITGLKNPLFYNFSAWFKCSPNLTTKTSTETNQPDIPIPSGEKRETNIQRSEPKHWRMEAELPIPIGFWVLYFLSDLLIYWLPLFFNLIHALSLTYLVPYIGKIIATLDAFQFFALFTSLHVCNCSFNLQMSWRLFFSLFYHLLV